MTVLLAAVGGLTPGMAGVLLIVALGTAFFAVCIGAAALAARRRTVARRRIRIGAALHHDDYDSRFALPGRTRR